MANPVWGQLVDSLGDTTTIRDAIDESIASHEADPTAPLGSG